MKMHSKKRRKYGTTPKMEGKVLAPRSTRRNKGTRRSKRTTSPGRMKFTA